MESKFENNTLTIFLENRIDSNGYGPKAGNAVVLPVMGINELFGGIVVNGLSG